MTVTAQAIGSSPPYVRVTVDGQTAASWTLVRVLGAQTEVVRGGSARTEAGTVVDDTEPPLNVTIRYRVVDDSDGSTVEESTDLLLAPTGYAWLTDPVSLLRARLQVDEWPEVSYPFQGGVFRVPGRPHPIVVSGERSGAEGTVTVSTTTAPEREDLLTLLRQSVTYQLRAVCPEVWQGYWTALEVKEQRVSNDGSDPRRTWTLALVQADRPDLSLLPTTDTLLDLHEDVGGDATGTLLGLSQQYPGTLLDIASAALSTLA